MVELTCRALDAEGTRLIAETGWVDTVRVQEYRKTQTRETRYMKRFLSLPPGDYVVEITMVDRNSGKSASRVRSLTVTGPKGSGPSAGDIQVLFHQRTGDMVPLLGPYLEEEAGPLVCSSEINNLHEGDSVLCTVTVIRVERDSSHPSPPYSFTAVQGSLEHDGIRFENSEIDFLDTVSISYPNGSQILWQFAARDKGIYLIKVEGMVYGTDGLVETISEASRPIVVVATGFPRPKQADQLVAAVEYIMLEREKDNLAAMTTTADRRLWLEQFWRSIGTNEEAASGLIERYYSRVEEANDYFSTFKEGWKTDRGMIYIVLGPPLSVQTGLQGELWSYSTVEGDELNSYYFREVELPEEFQGFEHLLLDRQAYYDQPWFAAVDRWRRGSGF